MRGTTYCEYVNRNDFNNLAEWIKQEHELCHISTTEGESLATFLGSKYPHFNREKFLLRCFKRGSKR